MIEKTAVFARYLLQPTESSCQREQSFKAGLNAMPSAAEVAGTESLDYGLTMETLVFPAYPIGKHHVQIVHNLDKFGLAELVVVIVPTSHLALNLYPHLLEFPVKMRMQLPLLHLLMQLLHRFEPRLTTPHRMVHLRSAQ